MNPLDDRGDRQEDAPAAPGALRTAAVVPVRGHARLLDGCLESLRAQTVPLDEIVVVDDSPDGSLGELEGVRVVRSGGRGPYAARNVGWRSTDADVLLFLDARSRPRPGWTREITVPFADPGVAMAGSQVQVLPGEGLGARASFSQQFYRLENYLRNPFFLPYLPTCNLAVRRADLEATDGFEEVRSGGDADFCWRVQDRPGRRLAAVEEVLMDWIPRDDATEYLEQNYRYGKSNHQLRLDWQASGAPVATAQPHRRLVKQSLLLAVRFARAKRRGDQDTAALNLRHAAGVCFDVGYRVAVDRKAVGGALSGLRRSRGPQLPAGGSPTASGAAR